MKGRAILEEVAKMKFPLGKISQMISSLDAEGFPSKLQQTKIILKICDVIDEFEQDFNDLKMRVSQLEEVENDPQRTRLDPNPPVQSKHT